VLFPVTASFEIAFSESRFSVIYGNLLLVLVAAPAGLRAVPQMNMHDALSVLYLGGGPDRDGLYAVYGTMARGVRSLDAGIVGYVEPVLNPVWVFLVLGERPSSWALVEARLL